MKEASDRLSVAMVNKYYPPHIGGIEFHVRDIAEGLVEYTGSEVSVTVCNAENRRLDEEVCGVRIHRLPRAFEFSSTPVSWGFASELRRQARSAAAPDVFHFHFPYPWGELSWLMAGCSAPVVVSYHSDIVRQKAALAVYRPVLERFLDRADLIIYATPPMLENSPYLQKHAEKCRHVDYGLHVERYVDDAGVDARVGELRAGLPGRRIVLFVGRLVYYKGADVLVRSMADVDAELVLIGQGPLESELREIAVAHSIQDRVHFLPPQDDRELASWYRAADVLALPSVAESEAFGLVQIEAHAAGTPAVSTDLPTGVPYANLDGVTGLTVPVGDVQALTGALNRLLSDDVLRERLGRQAQERALSQFTIERMARDTAAVYREAMELHSERTGNRR